MDRPPSIAMRSTSEGSERCPNRLRTGAKHVVDGRDHHHAHDGEDERRRGSSRHQEPDAHRHPDQGRAHGREDRGEEGDEAEDQGSGNPQREVRHRRDPSLQEAGEADAHEEPAPRLVKGEAEALEARGVDRRMRSGPSPRPRPVDQEHVGGAQEHEDPERELGQGTRHRPCELERPRAVALHHPRDRRGVEGEACRVIRRHQVRQGIAARVGARQAPRELDRIDAERNSDERERRHQDQEEQQREHRCRAVPSPEAPRQPGQPGTQRRREPRRQDEGRREREGQDRERGQRDPESELEGSVGAHGLDALLGRLDPVRGVVLCVVRGVVHWVVHGPSPGAATRSGQPGSGSVHHSGGVLLRVVSVRSVVEAPS
jgi:hypothetical protein